jgi:hypothetical protein
MHSQLYAHLDTPATLDVNCTLAEGGAAYLAATITAASPRVHAGIVDGDWWPAGEWGYCALALLMGCAWNQGGRGSVRLSPRGSSSFFLLT